MCERQNVDVTNSHPGCVHLLYKEFVQRGKPRHEGLNIGIGSKGILMQGSTKNLFDCRSCAGQTSGIAETELEFTQRFTQNELCRWSHHKTYAYSYDDNNNEQDYSANYEVL
ncbi:MAG: hypothetical protein WAW16_05335 [Candidatus Cryosericum sp.]